MASKRSNNCAFQVVLPVFNEELRIHKLLSYLSVKCSSILVVDNFSTDSTLSIIQAHFPDVQIVQISNDGTTETSEWWQKCSKYISFSYVYIASCSEYPTYYLLDYLSVFAENNLGDLLEVPRLSLTSGYSTDLLYCSALSVFAKRILPATVVRFVRWKSVDPTLIFPHSSFKNQTACNTISISASNAKLCIHHHRPYPSLASFSKHTAYAINYAKTRLKNNFFLAVIDSLLRSILDTLRVFRAALELKLSKVLLIEFFLRLIMHFQVIFYSLLGFLFRK